jgi:hypothetical protein
MHEHAAETFDTRGRSRRSLTLASTLLLAAGTVAGCASSSGDEQASSDVPTAAAPGTELETVGIVPVVLNEFTIEDERYSFQLFEDDASIMLVQEFRGLNRLDILTEQFGALTGLETFTALAPAGMKPHPRLVAAHESEALALQRADLAVRELDGRNMLLPKDSEGLCAKQYVYSSISPLSWVEQGGFQRIDLDGVFFYTCAGLPQKSGQGNPAGCESFHPAYLLRMAICNDSNPVSADPLEYQFYRGGVPVVDPFYKPLPPGQNKTVTLLPVANPPTPIVARSLGVKQKNKLRPGGFGNVSYQRGGVGR